MSGQTVLQGLRQAIFHQGTPRSDVVIDKKMTPIYRPLRRPTFFMDGGLAGEGREPLLICSSPRLKLRHPDGSVSWIPVSAADYDAAVIGQPFSKS